MTAVPVTGVVSMGLGRKDSRPWHAWSPVYRQGSAGEVITTRGKEFPVRVVAGVFSAMLEPGVCVIENPDGKQYTVTIPAEGGDLWDIIDDAVAFPPDTATEALAAAVTGWLEDNPVVTMQTEGITDSGAAGRAAVQADTAADLRAAAGGSTVGAQVFTAEDEAAGREALGAVTAAEALTDAQTRIAAWAGSDAVIDFTNKADGDPPSEIDTGQTVDFVYGPSNWKPQMSSGKLIAGTRPASGTYADYYQAQLDGACRAFGSRWTVNSADGSTQGVVCIAAWAGIYQTTGTIVPRHAAHVTFSTTTGAWQYWVSDGLDSAHFVMVKSGTFTAPASDGSAIWEGAVYVDPDNGIAHVYLPGNDSVTGNRFVSVTNAEIATAQTAASVPVRTLAYLVDGTSVVMVEHFASATPSTAIMPRFLNMWGQVLRPTRDAAALMRQRAIAPKTKSYKIHAPTTQLSVATTASTAIVDASNVFIEQYAGPTGVVLIDVSAWYEFTTGDTLFWRLRDSITAATTPALAAWVGTTGQNALVSRVMAFTGLTPGQRIVANLQHWSLVAATATLKAGGSSGHRPPLTLVAESI